MGSNGSELDDWTRPGAYRVADGVFRLPLPVPDPQLRAVNVYVVLADGGPLLVDGGWVGDDAQRALTRGLETLGLTLCDIRDVMVTHAHYDHYTLALWLRAQHGCRVWLGREEMHTVDSLLQGTSTIHQGALLSRCGAADWATEFTAQLAAMELGPDELWQRPDAWLSDGDITRGGLHVLETPGHTRGHIVLHDPERRLLFSGDHVLPHITPSIGFERAPEELPLRSYLQSLQRLRAMPDTALLPAHGPVSASTHRRVDELLAHHRTRLDSVLAGVHQGAGTARAVASTMEWTSRRRPLDELPLVHRGLAVIEVDAHLELLVHRRILDAVDTDGTRLYAARP